MLVAISLAFSLHVVGVYWWYQNDDLLYPLAMVPPKDIPPFWHAMFIIMVNGMFLYYCYCYQFIDIICCLICRKRLGCGK